MQRLIISFLHNLFSLELIIILVFWLCICFFLLLSVANSRSFFEFSFQYILTYKVFCGIHLGESLWAHDTSFFYLLIITLWAPLISLDVRPLVSRKPHLPLSWVTLLFQSTQLSVPVWKRVHERYMVWNLVCLKNYIFYNFFCFWDKIDMWYYMF